MIPTLLAIAAASAAVGFIGAMRRENWGLFFLFPAIGAVIGAPVAGGAVIVVMMTVEVVAGRAVRAAYSAEAFWAAAIVVGMALGLLFAVVAVVAGRKGKAA